MVMVPLVAGLGNRPAAVLALGTTVLARRPVLAVLRGDRGPALIPVLVDTGRVELLFGALFTLGLAVSA
jgi:1,4-dihydroxy-2-naphthoate octaprenyltransferase